MMLKSFPSHISKTKHVKYNVDKVITQTKQSYCFETTINTQNITKYRTYDLYRKVNLLFNSYFTFLSKKNQIKQKRNIIKLIPL